MWFLDGTDGQGKTVSSPNIGYGERKIHPANGDSREFYRVGFSANTTGISVYINGLDDKTYLARTYGPGIATTCRNLAESARLCHSRYGRTWNLYSFGGCPAPLALTWRVAFTSGVV